MGWYLLSVTLDGRGMEKGFFLLIQILHVTSYLFNVTLMMARRGGEHRILRRFLKVVVSFGCFGGGHPSPESFAFAR